METAVPLQMDQNNPTKIYIKCFINIYLLPKSELERGNHKAV